MEKGETFILTENHLKLLKKMYVEWEDCEAGAPAINCKRPYGNSNVEEDVARILGWEIPDEDEYEDYNKFDELMDELYTKANKIHLETKFALQICLQTQSFQPGTYINTENWCEKWERVN